jgi:hypothetical protein
MGASARTLAVCVLTVFFPACLPFPLFQDVGSDPHPPTLEVLGIALQPPTPAEGEPRRIPVFQPPDGLVVRPLNQGRNTFVLRVRFTDAGGDLVRIRLRDRDGALALEIVPAAPEVDADGDGIPEIQATPGFVPGISGTADLPDISFDVTQEGPHRIEVWAEDSHESRSEKIEFTVIVVLFP